MFVDLPEGKHSIKLRGMIIGGGPHEFDVFRGQITYIKLPFPRDSTIVSAQEAEPLLAETYHLFRLPLPFDKQDKNAEREKW
jgi:hypothetical protein